MDPASGLCKGCFRTLDEIAGWGAMSDLEHEKVFYLIAERRNNSNIPEIPVPPLA